MFKSMLLALTLALCSTNSSHAAMRYFNTAGADLGAFTDAQCGAGITCSQVSGKVLMVPALGNVTANIAGTGAYSLAGFKQSQVAATAVTLTAAQCGMSFINTGAVQVVLPDASTVLGCRYTFITGNASNFDVNPDDADQILVLTNAVGDAIRNATLGNSVTIEAISAVNWSQVAAIGTYTDIN